MVNLIRILLPTTTLQRTTTDALSSPTSCTAYDDSEIEKMLAYIRQLKRKIHLARLVRS
jgi:hypothetical protein